MVLSHLASSGDFLLIYTFNVPWSIKLGWMWYLAVVAVTYQNHFYREFP